MFNATRRLLIFALLATGTVLLAQQPSDPPLDIDTAIDGPTSPEDEATAKPTDDNEPASKDANAGAKTEAGEPAEDAAAETDEEGVMEPEMPGWQRVMSDILDSGAIGLLKEGGLFMWPILILGILATGVAIERFRSLMMLGTDTSAVRNEVADLLRADRAGEALKRCDAEQGPVPAVLSVGVRKFHVLRRLDYDPGRVEEQVVKAMDDYSVHIVAALERHLPILATVASVAPMLGFLGTVQGMIIAFRDIKAGLGKENIVGLAADGIQTALLTTCFGLIIGIPAYIAYNYFTGVINRYVLDVEESATELMETVTLHIALEDRETGG